MRLTALFAGIFFLCALVTWSGCGGDNENGTGEPTVDISPPNTVQNLTAKVTTRSRIILTWTAPGDDGTAGTATQYDLRYATFPITDDNWDTATAVTTSAPRSAGSQEQVAVTGLQSQTEYHFALQAADEADNWSERSNTVTAATNLVWYVTADGSGDAPTIRSACVDSATKGDEILVAPGRYTWSNQGDGNPDHGMIFFPRDTTGFVLRSEDGPEATIIDAESQGRVFFLQGITPGSTSNVTIEGFTITGGDTRGTNYDDSSGAGLVFHLCSPTIRNCIFTGNYANAGGGLCQAGVGHARVENCIFENNQAEYGAGIALFNSYESSTFTGCVIRDNHATLAGGGLFAGNIRFTLEASIISANRSDDKGGGISVLDIQASTVTGCTIAENDASWGGGIRLAGSSDLTVTRTILAYATDGGAVSTASGAAPLTIGCSALWGNLGGDGSNLPAGTLRLPGIIVQDPKFCGTTGTFDYRLQNDSPCAPGQHPQGIDCGLIGALPVDCGTAKSW